MGSNNSSIILTILENILGKEIVEHDGIVEGSTLRIKNIGKDFLAGLKNIVGGELKVYTELLQEARQESIECMVS